MKRFLLALAVAFVFLAMSAPSGAITDGGLDGEDHPYVGLMVADTKYGTPLWRCSGTLVSPTHFLTAGHCTEPPAARATIWFEADVESGIPGNGYPFGGATSVDGTVYTHPHYNPALFFLHDLGVVVLDEPVYLATYGALPSPGALDSLATARGRHDPTLTAVGYGLQRIIDGNPFDMDVIAIEEERVRLQATLNIVDLNGTAGIPAGTSVMVSGDARRGGTCFGDSGGPQFLADTNIVAAVTSFGLNGNCAGIGGGYRVDTADDLAWLESEFGLRPAE